ncbi:hypothetical protein IPH19_03360 [Candidatus Uhrbacteria bacterium]|nr:MAG: hypothetical protein IPH19_03360 [Candidatus Uhrbacteria bacterium]
MNGSITTLTSTSGTIATFNFENATGSSLYANTIQATTVSSTAVFVNGVAVCLASGTNCPTGTTPNLQTVTNAGNTTTRAIQFAGGTSTADFVFNTSATVNGIFTANGQSNLQNVSFLNATGSSLFVSLLTATNGTIDTLVSTNGTITSLSAVSVTTTNLLAASTTVTGTLTANNATATTLQANIATFATATVSGQAICLSNGVGCPSTSAEADTLASVTNRGAFATSSVTLFGGLTTSDLTATGTTSLQNTTITNGTTTNFAVTGLVNSNLIPAADLAFSLGNATNRWNANLGNVTSTSVTTTNLFATNAFVDTLGVTTFSASSGTITNFLFANATGTNLFVTNFNAGTGSINNFTSNSSTITNLFSPAATFTSSSIVNLTATTATITNLVLGSPLNLTNITWVNATGTNTTSTNLFATTFGFTNATGDSLTSNIATINTLTSVNGSITTLTSTSGTIATFNFENATGSSLYASTIQATTVSSTAVFVNGVAVCLASGTNCPTGTTPNLQTVTNAGNTTTRAIQFAGGTSTADFVFNTSATVNGIFTANGQSNLQNVLFTNATGNSLFVSLLTATNGTIDTLVSTNGTITSLSAVSVTTTNLLAASTTVTGTLTANNATATTLQANIATFATATVSGQAICLSNGVGCPSTSAEADTLASVTNRGAFATSSVTLFGGLTTSDLTATGTTSLQNTTITNGTTTNFAVTGLVNSNLIPAADLAFSLGNATNRWNANLGNVTSTSVTTTNLFATNAFVDTLGVTTFSASSGTITNFLFANATGTNLFVTNFNAGTGSINNFTSNSSTITNLFSPAATFTSSSIVNLTATTATITNLVLGSPLNLTNITWVNATGTNTTSTNLFATTFGFTNATGDSLTSNIATINTLTSVNGSITTLTSTSGTIATFNFENATGSSLYANTIQATTVSSTAVFVNGVAVCLASGTNCPAASGLDTLQSVTARGSFTTTTAQFFGGFVAASSSVTGTFAVAGTSTLLRDVYVGTSTYDVFLNSDFVLDGNDLFAADNIGSVSSIFSNGMLVTGETGPTLFGDGFINQTDGALVISANSSFLTQPSISIIAGDFTSGLAGDVNILAGNGLGGNPAGNIYLTPGDSLGQPGHLYLNAAGTSNQPQFRFESIGGGMVSLEAPNTANTESFVLPFADGASSTVIGTNGTGILTFVSVCLTDGTNCPASSGLDTLQSVTARGSFTTTTAQFFGGFVAASSSVTGTFVVVGSTSLRNVDFTTATGTSVTTTNLFATLGSFTTATATNANINILTAATGTVSSLNFRNATGTFLFASTGTFATVTSSFLYANTANFATATVSGVGICLSNGVGCPAAGSVAVSLDSAYDGPSGSGSGRTIFADNGAVNIIVPTTGTSPGLVINHQEDSSFVNAVEIYSTGTNLALFVQRNNSNFDTNSARFINTNPGGSSITVESSDTYLSFLANRTLSGGTSVISSLSSTGVAQGLNFNARSFDFRTAPDGITQFSALSMLQSGATTFNTSSTESATAWKVNNFGSGPSLEVFDGGNALSDNTSFMIDDNGDVGIGLNPGEVKLSVLSSRATTTAVARFSSTSSADFDLFVATGTPEGNTSGSPGDLAVDTRDGRLFVKTTGGSTGWLSVCLSDGTNCPAASGLDTLQSVTARGSFTTTTAQFFGGFVAASSSVTGTFAVAGTSTLLRDVYVGTSTYSVTLNSDFVLDGNDLFAADNIGSVSSIFSNGMLVTGETGPTLFGDGFINQTDGALVISANSSFLTQPSISIIAGDFTSGLAGDVNILAGNGLGGNPAGNIYLTPGDSLGQPGHLYLNAAGTSNQPQFRFESIGGGMVSLEAPNTANTESFVLPFADGASSTVIGTNGTGILTFVSVCLTDGTNCPASSGLDTLQSVTARGSFTTTTAQFFGGFVAASSSVTGTFVVVGSTSLRNVDFTTATGTSVTTTNLFATLGSFTTATATNANINILSAATGTVSNLNFRNATGTFLFASTGTFATVTSSFLYANTANFATATVSGVGICLSNGVGCPASGSSNDTLLTITNRGAIATSTFTLYGGFVAASSSVTGTLNVVGSLNVFGGTSSRIAFEAPLEQYVTATTPFTTMATTYVGNDPRVVVVQGNYAYIMSNTPQLHIVDVSNPSAPILMSTTTLSGGSSWSDLVVSGDYVYTVDFGGTMNVVDVSNPRRPLVTDTLSLSGPGEIEVAGRYAYVAEWSSSRIAVIDISDPYNISVLSQTASDLEAWGMEVQGDYVYTSAYGSGPFNVYNVSDPNTVRRVGTTGALSSLSNEVPLRVQGSYAYLGSAASNYFYVIDISNATGPTVIFQGAVTSTSISNYKYFSVNGDYVYVSEDGTGEMHVIDISNPRYPRYVKTHTYSPTTNFGIDVAGRYAYVLHQGASDSMSIIKVGGSETNALLAHSFEAGTLNVLGIADFQNFVSIRTGLSVGSAGINSFGSLNVYATNTTSTFYGAVSTSRLMVGGYAVCLSNGTNCPAASGLDTLQSVTARGSFTTTTAQFFGGFVAASSSVTGTFRVIGSSIVNGTSTVTGSSSFNGVDFVRATGTSVTTTNLFATNALFTGATGTTVTSSQVFWNNATGARLFVYGATFNDATSSNFFVNTMLGFTSATGVSLNVNGFTAATASIAGLNFRNATGVNLFTTNVTTTNLSVLGTFSATNLAWTNATGTFLTVTTSTQTFSSIRYVSSSQLNVNTAVLMRMGQASSVGSPTEVFVSGRYAYVNSAAFADINIYDISDPNAPTSVSSIQMPGGNSGNAYVVGDYLYTGDQGTQLRIYDISNRRDPRL